MNKNIFMVLAVLIFVSFSFMAAADPIQLAEDYADTVTVFFNGTDASDGWYEYSYRYPHAAVPENEEEPSDISAACINRYYEQTKIAQYIDDFIPDMADYYASQHQNVSVEVNYEITCNNDDYFSVLLHRIEEVDGEIEETWEGNTFARSSKMIGSLTSLPKLLGILEAGESDEWLEDRQTDKIWEVICKLVWESIRRNDDGYDFDPNLSQEDLEFIINPEYSLDHDFYMNENGELVFFILSREILTEEAAEETGIVTFTMSLEDIDDEM